MFDHHINYTSAKTDKIFGVLCRNSGDFKIPITFRILFIAYVNNSLNYYHGSVI